MYTNCDQKEYERLVEEMVVFLEEQGCENIRTIDGMISCISPAFEIYYAILLRGEEVQTFLDGDSPKWFLNIEIWKNSWLEGAE